MLLESVNCLNIETSESKNSVNKKTNKLIQQIKQLSQWVINFDPASQMNESQNMKNYGEDMEKAF